MRILPNCLRMLLSFVDTLQEIDYSHYTKYLLRLHDFVMCWLFAVQL